MVMKSKIKALAASGSGKSPLLHKWPSSHCAVKRAREFSWASFTRALIPGESHPDDLISSQSPPPNTPCGLEFQHKAFSEDTAIQCIAQLLQLCNKEEGRDLQRSGSWRRWWGQNAIF